MKDNRSVVHGFFESSSAPVVKCEHPLLILHPYFKYYFVTYGKFCFDGQIVSSFSVNSRESRLRRYDIFIKQYIKPFLRKFKVNPPFDHDFLLDNFHFIGNDGIVYPMFLIVPCGKCSVCCYNKVKDISARCSLETYTSKNKPLFVTLTYNNDSLPEDGCLHIEDIQKFLKRLRINLNRFFRYKNEEGKFIDAKISLRYIYCGEYTPNSSRPHFHLLIWNVPYIPNGLSDYQRQFLDSRCKGFDSNNARNYSSDFIVSNSIISSQPLDVARFYGYLSLKKMIYASWQKGFVKVEVARDAGGYVAKYIGKGSQVPQGFTPTFVRWSTRRGLGFDAFDLHFKSLLMHNPKLMSLSFVDPKVGKLQRICVPKYFRNLLAPSLSSLAKEFRPRLENLHYVYDSIKYLRFKYGLMSDIYNDIKPRWIEILDKYDLFKPLCSLTIPLLHKNDKKELDDIFKVSQDVLSYPVALDCISHLTASFIYDYEFLKSYPLEKLHLQDILDYKVLNTTSRIEFAKNNTQSFGVILQEAQRFYTNCLIKSKSNDYEEYLQTDKGVCETS